MAHGIDKYRSRRNRVVVRELFWKEWDPIGINTASAAKDEYDRYADKAYVMLMDENRSAQEIADYLYRISTEYIGLTASQQLRNLADQTANKLIALRPSLEAESDEP